MIARITSGSIIGNGTLRKCAISVNQFDRINAGRLQFANFDPGFVRCFRQKNSQLDACPPFVDRAVPTPKNRGIGESSRLPKSFSPVKSPSPGQ